MQKEDLKYIGLHYGYASQSQIFIEEMSELTKAICKFNREKEIERKTELWADVEEELADVLILAGQFCEIWADEKTVETIAKAKIERQLKRIMEETEKC